MEHRKGTQGTETRISSGSLHGTRQDKGPHMLTVMVCHYYDSLYSHNPRHYLLDSPFYIGYCHLDGGGPVKDLTGTPGILRKHHFTTKGESRNWTAKGQFLFLGNTLYVLTRGTI
jgi:hypothetical protein